MLPSILKMFEDFFCIDVTSILLDDNKRISLPHPLPFESAFLRVCAFEIELQRFTEIVSYRDTFSDDTGIVS